ncbi:MAG: hypothetical protein ACE5GN_06205, partial [Waddliaceae bacterium]
YSKLTSTNNEFHLKACMNLSNSKITLSGRIVVIHIHGVAFLVSSLQSESRKKGDKKSKGWFINQALLPYMKTENLIESLQQARLDSRYNRIKSWCINQVLKIIKYLTS